MQARNQSYLRRKNKKSIIDLLRQKSQSYSDIARELRLSNTAVAKIVDDLINQNIVVRESDTKGRTGINLSINCDFGYIIAIDLSRYQITFSAADFGSNILEEIVLNNISFKTGDIKLFIDTVHKMINGNALKNRTLRCIAIATPGKIDKASGKFILSPRFRELGNISFRDIFRDEFGCLVVVKNDIDLALLGEKMYDSALKDVENALMLHVDVGVGASILINGKVYEGSHGFAGEIGYFKLNMALTDEDNYGNITYANYFDITSLFSCLSFVKRELSIGKESIIQGWIKERGITWDDVTIDMLIEAYKLDDPLIVKIVNSAARIIGTFAQSVADLLDIEIIILNGSVIGFGEKYLKYISKYTGDYPMVFAQLGMKTTVMGAVNAGILAVYDEQF